MENFALLVLPLDEEKEEEEAEAKKPEKRYKWHPLYRMPSNRPIDRIVYISRQAPRQFRRITLKECQPTSCPDFAGLTGRIYTHTHTPKDQGERRVAPRSDQSDPQILVTSGAGDVASGRDGPSECAELLPERSSVIIATGLVWGMSTGKTDQKKGGMNCQTMAKVTRTNSSRDHSGTDQHKLSGVNESKH
ncbi:hypothetical protein ZHAS_00007012 [Anopheles sinensis]|uniref:Uncharacterized protein n=1 Tax=Anopheles sinensis TaxID=74873 RepID=A0A084VNN2_ANOSI|nr:hypothetical protein ZHAS_00007012 [Anopheles sinensis]